MASTSPQSTSTDCHQNNYIIPKITNNVDHRRYCSSRKTSGLMIRAHLPNQQRTTVNIPAGTTVREALCRALAMRKLEPEMCCVYKYTPQINLKQRIDWDVDVSMLRGDEIVVETKDRVPMHTQISHNFAKSFFSLSKCNFCQDLLMIGHRCVTCGIEFHRRCSKFVPPLCEPAIENRNLFRHLLARSNGNSSTNGSSNTSTNSTSNHSPIQLESKTNHQYHNELLEEKWEIDGSEIMREPMCIGRGSFGTVYKGYWHGPIALKELNVKNPTPAQLEAFQNEVVVLKSTRHKNVMLFMGYVLKPTLTIVTQWCEGRSLYKHLHVDEIPSFTNKKIIDIAGGVAQGMEYLHARNIIHRDLKSSNVFLHDDLTVKIGDFGLATVKTRWEGNTQRHHPTGSVQWMAPEVIRTQPGVNPFTFKADVYSYGNLLYELLTRRLPYFDFEGGKEVLLFLIGKGMIELNLSVIEPDKPKELRDLMTLCTQRQVDDRPTFNVILDSLTNIKLRTPKLLRTTSEPLKLNNFDESMPSES